MVTAIKRAASILLLLTFFLPMSQCTVTVPIAGSEAVEHKTTVTYAYSAHKWPSTDAAVTLFAFIWPFTFMVIGLIRPARTCKAPATEAILCAGSGYILLTLAIFKEPLIGWWLAGAALTTYFAAASLELVGCMRRARWVTRFWSRVGKRVQS